MGSKRLLIIKHGALGDIIKSLGVIEKITEVYKAKGFEIDCLTTSTYLNFVEKLEIFSRVWVDNRGGLWSTGKLLLKGLPWRDYTLVIDLQNSRRTNRYGKFITRINPQEPLWSGTLGEQPLNYPFTWKKTHNLYDRFAHQLKSLGIFCNPEELMPNLNWLPPQNLPIQLEEPYALLIPGSSPSAPEKRWPAAYYGELAKWLTKQGIRPILIGGPDEVSLVPQIQDVCPHVITGIAQWTLWQAAALAKGAKAIIGNDTGPLYLLQASGRPTLVLWSSHSDPAIHAPLNRPGSPVAVLQRDDLMTLAPNDVVCALQQWGL